jgi:hypothetical protein
MVYTGTTGLYEAAKEMFFNTQEQAKKINKKIYNVKDVYINNVDKSLYPAYEPKKNNRALLTFVKTKIPQWVVKSFTRPAFPLELNNTITVVLHDAITPSTTKSVIDLFNDTNGLNKKKLKLKIEMLDPTGVVVEKWILKGCVITEMVWSPIDYTNKNDTIATITLTVRYNQVKIK